MFQNLQKERESEEKKLEVSKVTLQEQQQQLEKELASQKSRLDQVLSEVLAAEERARTLKEEERRGESLEKTLSQTSRCLGAAQGCGRQAGQAPGGGRKGRAGKRPVLCEMQQQAETGFQARADHPGRLLSQVPPLGTFSQEGGMSQQSQAEAKAHCEL